MDKTEFIKLNDFEASEAPDPDALIAEYHGQKPAAATPPAASTDQDELLRSLGM
jgi:chemotaxis protein CheX